MDNKNPPFKPNDRIRLTHMGKDPHPIKPGTVGTVESAHWFQNNWQVYVRWDNGRSLGLVMPPDKAVLLK